MRHRAPRPLIDLWRRLPGQFRVLVALIVVLGLATSAYVARGSVTGGSSSGQLDSAGLGQRAGTSASPDGERQDPTQEMPTSEGRTPNSSPGTPSARKRKASSPATGGTPSLRSGLDQVTGSPSPDDTTPQDVTPPETSLTEEFPSADAAQFSFSANESASFTCSLDGAVYTPCDSAVSYSDLDPGWHTFAVRATDTAGNVDPTPAETRWHARDGRSADH